MRSARSGRGGGLSERLFLSLPLPLSKWSYRFARRTVYRIWSEPYWEMAVRWIAEQNVTGHFLEFGVYRGTSFITFWHLAQKFGLSSMRFFGFDSFAGLPGAEGPVWKPGMFACSRERASKLIVKGGVDWRSFVLVEGLYEKSLVPELKRTLGLTKAALIHVDCDLCTSTKTVLAWIEDLVDVGTVLLFDEWGCFPDGSESGERRAFSDWALSSRFDDFYQARQIKGFVCSRQV